MDTDDVTFAVCAVCMAFLVDAQDSAAGTPEPAPHPLAPLTAAEIEAAAGAVKADKGLGETARFVYISLCEPSKHEVIASDEGGQVPARLAKVVIRERAERATYEAIVKLATQSEVLDYKRVPGVQPSVMLEEFMAAEDIVRKDPRWQEAMRRRGITDFDLCMIDPWSTPNVELGVGPDDGRFVSPLTWVRDDPDDNGYAHPVDGVVTRVDLDTLTVVSVEDYGVLPVPAKKANYSTAKIADPDNVPYFPEGPRQDVKPLDIIQHDGPSFQVDGYHLTWQKWDLRIGFTAREGLVLHRISYAGRSIIHRASLSEMFVPYGDPGPMHYRKLVLDEGEYGIGLLTNSLELGCDCLGEIAYLDGVVNDNDGKAVTMPNAICLHEEDHGIAWKHTDFRTGYVEVRRMRRMVVSSIVTVGNYEYAYYWYLYQDGTIEYEVKCDLQRRHRGRAQARARRHRRARRLRPASPALLQRPAGHGRRRDRQPGVRGHPDRGSGGPGEHRRQRLAGEGSSHRGRDHGQTRGRSPRGPLLEDRQRPRQEQTRPARRLQADAVPHDQALRAPRLRRRQACAVHVQPDLGHRL
jgi:primary-amine oxidase